MSHECFRYTFLCGFSVLICEDPPAVPHATYQSRQRWLNGSTVIYTCDVGYEMAEGSGNDRTCDVIGSDVQWRNNSVNCVPGMCERCMPMSSTW